jgi:two-component system LytT family sensor kinase
VTAHAVQEDTMIHTPSEYSVALRRVRRLRRFYRNLALYGAIVLGLALLNALVSPGRYWFQWPALGLALAGAIQGASLFVFTDWLGADWEERKVRSLLRDGREG